MPQSVGCRHFVNRSPQIPEGEADMLDKMTERLDFQSKALVLRAERQRAIASNIANADTPGYVARDFNFREALTAVTSGPSPMTLASVSQGGHIPRSEEHTSELQ